MEFQVGDWLVEESVDSDAVMPRRIFKFICVGNGGLIGTAGLLRARPLGGAHDINLMADFCRKATEAEVAAAVARRIGAVVLRMTGDPRFKGG